VCERALSTVSHHTRCEPHRVDGPMVSIRKFSKQAYKYEKKADDVGALRPARVMCWPAG